MRRRDVQTSMLLQRVAMASIRFVDQVFENPANYDAGVPMRFRFRVRPNEGIDYNYGTSSYYGPEAGVSFYAVHDGERDRDTFIIYEEREESSTTKPLYTLDAASVPPRLEIALQKFDALEFDHELTPGLYEDKIGVTIADPSGRGHFEFFVFAGRLEELKRKAILRIRRFILLKLKAVAAFLRERECGTAAKRLQCVR